MQLIEDLWQGAVQGLQYEYRAVSKYNGETWHPVYIRSVDRRQVELVPITVYGTYVIIDGIPFGTDWNTRLHLDIADCEKRLRRKVYNL